MMMDIIAQIGIIVFGATAIILVAKKNKWGFVVGLISQPFYFITSFINKQWGIFFIAIIYSFTWMFGIYEWFFKDKKSLLKQRKSKISYAPKTERFLRKASGKK